MSTNNTSVDAITEASKALGIDEILIRIFQHLDFQSIQYIARLVCQKWYQVIKRNYSLFGTVKALLHSDDDPMSKIDYLYSNWPEISQLKLRIVCDNVKYCQFLKELGLNKFERLSNVNLHSFLREDLFKLMKIEATKPKILAVTSVDVTSEFLTELDAKEITGKKPKRYSLMTHVYSSLKVCSSINKPLLCWYSFR